MYIRFSNAERLLAEEKKRQGESRGIAVEHLAHDQMVVGLIPVQSPNAGWKWCQSHVSLMIAGAWSSSLMLHMIDNQSCVGK